MHQWILLLRGINVGGNNIVPMQQLKAMLADLDCVKVESYIQSGNLVLQHPTSDTHSLLASINHKMQEIFGFQPQILLLTLKQMIQAKMQNPFSFAESDPKTLHLFFLAAPLTQPDLSQLTRLKKDSESFKLVDSVFYLYAPQGIGRSKLATNVEKCLGVPVTARNWNTVSKVLALAEAK